MQKITSNIQVNVTNLSVKYKEKNIIANMTCDSIALQSADPLNNWVPSYNVSKGYFRGSLIFMLGSWTISIDE